MIKLLPSYVGSKSFWVEKLEKFRGKTFVEPFCGSAVLSINLAAKAILNDVDPFVYKIISRFNEQIVPLEFSKEDFFSKRKELDWWKYAFCLQKMSFSGVFRYSKNGYNVPIKTDKSVFLQDKYQEAVERWKVLSPVVLNQEYDSINSYITNECVLILDPPYEKAQASYNYKANFDYHKYWEYVRMNENICENIVIFDYESNLPFKTHLFKKSRVNGARRGDIESMFIFEKSLREGQKGEEIFHGKYPFLNRLDGLKSDFDFGGRKIELKSDYYCATKTSNFFIERWSDKDKQKDGGPWQALENGNDYYLYYFVKNNKLFIFDCKKLVETLEVLIKNYSLVDIKNKSWITQGYKIPREELESLFLDEKTLFVENNSEWEW